MKRNNYLFIILLSTLLSSCTKDFLDVDDTQRLFRESYVKDLSTMQQYLNGIYYRLSRYFEAGIAEGSYAELVADNIRPISVDFPPNTAAHYNWMQGEFTGNMTNLWLNNYMTVRMCNYIIEEIDKYKDENATKANGIKGQAFAIRALIYFKLANVFAQPYKFTTDASHLGIPYITASDITIPYSRQRVSQVYDAMISDLTNAIQNLDAETSDTRYMNRNAAKALLARVYLFKEDYTNAKTLALEITNQVPLMTIATGYPIDIYKLKHPSETESLFQLSPNSASNFLGRYVRRNPIAYIATNDIASILTESANDIRISWINNTAVGWTVTKFPKGVAPEANPPVSPQENGYYPALLRSSEMFLVVAEAAAKTNDETMAKSYINAVRKRADPFSADITATGQALVDSIYKERRKELAFEGIRMFDLLRLGKGVNRTDIVPGSQGALPYPSNRAISPIPFQEIRLSGLPQNAGY